MPDSTVPKPKQVKATPKGPEKPWPPVGKSRKIFALLAGINAYPGAAELIGCIKDVETVENYLRTQVHKKLVLAPNISVEANDELYLCTLKDEQATYENIITGFRKFLRFADGDDTVWFHFSGHGSQQPTAKEFETEEANNKDQALVCFYTEPDHIAFEQNTLDPNKQFLLADKELAKLIEEVATEKASGEQVDKGTPHIIITLDCCHSGTGTRDGLGGDAPRPRALNLVSPPARKLETYLFVDGESTFGKPSIRRTKHVSISACKATEKAVDTKDGGVFTTSLIQALNDSNHHISYADLTNQIEGLTKQRMVVIAPDSSTPTQTPILDPINHFNVFTKFLDPSEIIGKTTHYDVHFDGINWIMNAGVIHGLPNQQTEEIKVNIQLLDGTIIGETLIEKTSAFHSTLSIPESLTLKEEETKYKAEILNLAIGPMFIEMDGDETGITSLTEAWISSTNILPTIENDSNTKYRVFANDGHYQIIANKEEGQVHYDTNVVMGNDGTAYDQDRINAILLSLEKMARWERFAVLDNQSDSKIRTMVKPTITMKNKEQHFASPPLPGATFTSESTIDLAITKQQFIPHSVNRQAWDFLIFFCDVDIDTQMAIAKETDLNFYFFHLGSDFSINQLGEVKSKNFKEITDANASNDSLNITKDEAWGLPSAASENHCVMKLLVTSQPIDNIKQLEQIGLFGTKSPSIQIKPGVTDDWCCFNYTFQLKRQKETQEVT